MFVAKQFCSVSLNQVVHLPLLLEDSVTYIGCCCVRPAGTERRRSDPTNSLLAVNFRQNPNWGEICPAVPHNFRSTVAPAWLAVKL